MAEREDGGGTPPNQYRRRGLPKKSLGKDFANAIGLRATSSSGGKPPSRLPHVDTTRHIHGPSPPADTIVLETGVSLERGGTGSSHSSRRGRTPTESRLPRAGTHESSDQPDSLGGGMQSLSPDVSADMVSRRIHISPYSETCFVPYAAQDHIAHCIKGHFHGPYRSWEEVAKAGAVDQWFSVFQSKCSWDPVHHNRIFSIFCKLGRRRLMQAYEKIRREKDPTKRKEKACWMTTETLETLEAWWDSPEFKDMSSRMSQIRCASGEEMANYAGGRVSVSGHRLKMQEADPEKRDPGFFKPWNKCYTKKDGKKVNKKMENFEAQYLAEVEEITQRSDGEAEFDEALLFAEIAGGKNKGRIPGMGSESHLVPGRRRRSYYGDGCSTPISFMETSQFQNEVDRRVEERVSQRMSQLQSQVQEDMDRRTAQMESQYQDQLAQMERRHQDQMASLWQAIGKTPPAAPQSDG